MTNTQSTTAQYTVRDAQGRERHFTSLRLAHQYAGQVGSYVR